MSSENDASPEQQTSEIVIVPEEFAKDRIGKRNLTDNQRRVIYDYILKLSDGESSFKAQHRQRASYSEYVGKQLVEYGIQGQKTLETECLLLMLCQANLEMSEGKKQLLLQNRSENSDQRTNIRSNEHSVDSFCVEPFSINSAFLNQRRNPETSI